MFKRITEILEAPTNSLRKLARIANANPATFFHGADLRGIDLSQENLEGFDLSKAITDEAMEVALSKVSILVVTIYSSLELYKYITGTFRSTLGLANLLQNDIHYLTHGLHLEKGLTKSRLSVVEKDSKYNDIILVVYAREDLEKATAAYRSIQQRLASSVDIKNNIKKQPYIIFFARHSKDMSRKFGSGKTFSYFGTYSNKDQLIQKVSIQLNDFLVRERWQ